MSNEKKILKPQAPLMRGEDYVMPLTTADQVVLANGKRLEQNGLVVADVATYCEQGSLPSGGATGQVLSKKTGTDYDAEWIDPPESGSSLYANLADNSDFTHWVAQADIGGNHGAQAYGGDRWILTDGTITGEENADGDGYSNIMLNGTLVQVVPSPPAVATAFVEMVSGEATISYDASVGEIILTSAGGVIKNVLLLEGEWTKKPDYVAKGYAAELTGCLLYFQIFNARARNYPGGNGTVCWPQKFGVPMRINPTKVSISAPSGIGIGGDSGSKYGFSIYSSTTSGDGGLVAHFVADLARRTA